MKHLKTKAILAMGLIAATCSQAATFTTSVVQVSGQTWDNQIWLPGPVTPSAGNSYVLDTNSANYVANTVPLLRNPTTSRNINFAGDSLRLRPGTQIRLKGNSVPQDNTINFGPNGLILDGGFVGNGDDMTAILPAMFTVNADASIYAGQDATTPSNQTQQRKGVRAFLFSGPFVGAGNLTLGNAILTNNLPNFRFTSPNSSFSGSVTVTAGWLQVGALGAMGTGNITLAGGSSANGVNGPVWFDATVPYVTTGSLTISNSNSTLMLRTNMTFGAVTINGTALANGVYTAAQINAITGGSNVVDTNGVNTLTVGTGEVAPAIVSQTASMTNDFDTTARFEVTASGTSLHFQWQRRPVGGSVYTNMVDGPNTFGSGNAVLTLNHVTPYDSGDYIVIVSNSVGSVTSSVPTILTIIGAQITSQSATNQTLYAGINAQLFVTARGVPPLTYQWQKNGSDMPNATNAVLTFTNLKSSDAAVYSVTVTSPFGSATNVPITLSLTSPPDGTYAQNVAALGPVAYWRLNEGVGGPANDYVGGHNGAYQKDAQFFTGPSSAAFGNNNLCLYSDQQNIAGYASAMTVPASAGLNLNTNTVTIAAWFMLGGSPGAAGLIMQRDSSGVAGLTTLANGDLGYNWNNDAATTGWDSGLQLPYGTWTYVSLVVTPTNATIYMYTIDGQTMQTATFVHNHINAPFSGQLDIGDDPTFGVTRTFVGLIDEVAIFNRALSNGEVSQLYTLGSDIYIKPGIVSQSQSKSVMIGSTALFSASATGSEPLSYQWQRNGVNIDDQSGKFAGSKTATLSIRGASASDDGIYTVIISNPGGSVTNTPAALTVVKTNYNAQVMELGPLGYWRLNEASGTDAADSAGHGLNGTYGSGLVLGGTGPNPPFGGFDNSGGDAMFLGATNSYVSLPALNLNSDTVTFTMWVYPTIATQPKSTGLFFWRDSGGKSSGLCFANSGNSLNLNWNNDTNLWTYDSGLIPPQNQWSFVAVVVSPSVTTFYLYNTNGVTNVVHNYSVSPAAFSGEVRIGSDSLAGGGRNFTGRIGEVALFNYSLTQAQLDQIYSGATNTVLATATDVPQANLSIGRSAQNVQIRWSQGVLLEAPSVNGPWTTNSALLPPFTVTPGAQKFYRVVPQ